MPNRDLPHKPSDDQDADDRASVVAALSVSRETEARLATYVDLLRRWQRIKNLVAPSTLEAIWTRHIGDSAQLVSLMPEARRWVDLGSGAGFPGLVIAILMAGQPDHRVDLIESNARKCAFLREVVRATGAPARIHPERLEVALPLLEGPVDVVTSRALAPLPKLVALSDNLLNGGATGLFMVGDESSTVTAIDGYDLTAIPSRTRMASRIVRVRRIGLAH